MLVTDRQMTTLSELVATKTTTEAVAEYNADVDSKPLAEREAAFNGYTDDLENAELAELQECYLSDIQEAVRNRNASDLKRLSESGTLVFSNAEYVALKMRAAMLVTGEDFYWLHETTNNILKEEALSKGRLDIVASILEQEVVLPSRADELAAVDKELVDLYLSCGSLLNDFFPRLREVRDTVLTDAERDLLLVYVDAVDSRDMARLDSAMILGDKTVEYGAAPHVYGIAGFFLMAWQMCWSKKAVERLYAWNAAGRDINNPPKTSAVRTP